MKGNFRKNTGIQKLYKKYQEVFRIPENLNHYSDEDFKKAEKKFLRHCFFNGKIEVFNPEDPVPR